MSDQSLPLINQSAEAINNQDFEAALHFADQAIAMDESVADAHTMRAIALSQLRQPDTATASFQRAISLDPSSVKAFYNFATHLYGIGRKQDALTYANQALAREPGHAASTNLVRLIEQEFTAQNQPVNTGMPYSGPPQHSPYAREGYGPPPSGTNTIPFINNLGPFWVTLGWIISIGSAVVSIYSISLVAPYMGEIMKSVSTGGNAESLAAKFQGLVPAWVTIFGYLMQATSFGWMLVDLIHRRGNFLWLIPMAICTCCGWQFMVLPLYIATGRGNKT